MRIMAEPTDVHARHHGVVAIVTDPERTRFFIQQKDEAYRPFPRGYSLFGGAVEAGEEPERALARELREELGAAAEPLLAAGPTCIFTARPLTTGFVVSLFEIVLDGPALESLAEVRVLEGERGVVLDRERLRSTPLVWGLGELVAAYLDRPAARTRDGS
jgi:8-oxo-dGTP pyrophosphatase MutT (NUDIX family)